MVIAVMAILSTVVYARIYDTLVIVNESNAKANLSIVRVALMKYYSDNSGRWPGEDIETLICPDYLNRFPKIEIAGYPITNSIRISTITNSGGWAYFPDTGDIRINCTDQSSEDGPYSEW
jgi:Tfp pilus assembly protein PilE